MKKFTKFIPLLIISFLLFSSFECSTDDDDNIPENNEDNNGNSNGDNNTPKGNDYFSEKQINQANTAKDADYLSEQEKLVILYCNLARMDGVAFTNAYLDNIKNSNNEYEKTLISDLKDVKDVQLLYPNENLCKASKAHASDMNKNNFFAHDSYDGTGCFDRVKKYYKGGYMAENISGGYSDALSIVKQLLIDKNTPSLGHRKNILGSNYCRIGVGIDKHPTYRYCCVQDFSDSKGD
ncbi:MAG: CAP domain-containing protein [Bacteroidales bacterium]|nr:CAP domain-containing protein [Bacteroidales bacterium]